MQDTKANAISVAVHAADPVTRLGLVGHIRTEVRFVPVAAAQAGQADVVVVAVESVDASVLEMLEQLSSSSSSNSRFLLIVAKHWYADLQSAVDCGVRAVLWRAEFTSAKFTKTIISVGEGEGDFPPDLQGKLLDQVQKTYQEVLAPRGLTTSGLSDREIAVLRLISEGCDLAEIARELSYSERTVKNLLYGLMKRHKLRTRAHAVSHAFRCGLI